MQVHQRVTLLLLAVAVPLAGQSEKKHFTVAEIFNSSKFRQESLRGVHWADDGKSFFYTEYDSASKTTNFMRYDVTAGERTVHVAGADIRKDGEPFRFKHAIWSPDETSILFTETLPARRVKTGGDFHLYDIERKTLRQLTDTDQKQVNVKFSPHGQSIAFVRANNLVLMDLATGKETQLTHDGREHLLNGHFDWVYEEEFGIIEGWYWSPDGRYIAYWQLDERRVPGFSIPLYNSVHLAWNHMRYPKAGDPNAIVKIGVVDVQTGRNVWVDLGSGDDFYVPRITWLPEGHRLAIFQLNRLQNKLEMVLADVTTGETRPVSTETADTWLEIDDDLTFLEDSNRFIWTSERDGFNHLYLYDLEGNVVRQLTRGPWEVREVVGVHEADGVAYFMAAEKSPLENHLYRVGLDGKGLERITRAAGWHRVNFAPTFDLYIDDYSDHDTPPRVGLFTKEGQRKAVLVENPMKILNSYAMGETEFFTFETTDGVELNGWMLKPPDFDPNKRHPVLMYVYGGPGSQTVRDAWPGSRGLWFQLLAQKGYIVASVDNRGTGGRGADFKKITYKNLGHWETHDQIQAAKYLGGLPYVDAGRIGIFGWSYGGYMSSLCLFKGHDVFKAAISVAPVTHWKFYDTIYTERYMQTPQMNPEGYEESAPINHAGLLEGHLLLIHGTADDNVHFQNAVALVDSLIANNKQFQTMLYPDRYHGIHRGSKYTREHLYTLMTHFLLENL